VTEAGARVATQSQAIVDRVHEEALATLPADERTVLLRAMKRLVTGHLASPVETAAPVRRARQRES
jgi:hypothetical protein